MAYVPFLPGQLPTADLLNTRLIELVMDWTPLDDIGNFTANGSAGTPPPFMAKAVFLGVPLWLFRGRINTSGITAAATVTVFNFDPAHATAAERGFMQFASNTAHYAARVSLTSGGAITVSVPTAGGSGMSGFLLDGMFLFAPQ